MGAWTYQNERLVTVPLGKRVMTVEQKLDGPLPLSADGTNRRMWPTATVLSNYLAQNAESLQGKSVCELGAGSGAVGIACAVLGAKHVVITDVEEALPLIRDNVQRNHDVLSCDCTILPCQWGNGEHIASLLAANGGAFDLVIACEVVYKQCEDVLLALASTQQQLMARPDGVSLLAYEYRGEFFDDLVYFDAANAFFDCEPSSLRAYEGELLDQEYGEEDGRWLYTYSHKPKTQ